ncbi:hypothetical protein L7F22_036045 [Adiantum nelumboides]|nr:hypothetical protein [Adiantum nelumboides]
MDVWDSHALLWSDTTAELFHVVETGHRLVSSLPCFGCKYYALHQSYIFKVQGLTIEVLDLQGTLRHRLELSERQGRAVALDVCLDFFLVGTENSFFQMWKLEDDFNNSWLPGFGRKIASVEKGVCNTGALMCNYNGTKVSFIAKSEGDNLESVLYIYDTVFDRFSQHDFRLEGKFLVSLAWDSEDFQQLACGLTSLDASETNKITEIVTYFVDPELRLIKQDKVTHSSIFSTN